MKRGPFDGDVPNLKRVKFDDMVAEYNRLVAALEAWPNTNDILFNEATSFLEAITAHDPFKMQEFQGLSLEEFLVYVESILPTSQTEAVHQIAHALYLPDDRADIDDRHGLNGNLNTHIHGFFSKFHVCSEKFKENMRSFALAKWDQIQEEYPGALEQQNRALFLLIHGIASDFYAFAGEAEQYAAQYETKKEFDNSEYEDWGEVDDYDDVLAAISDEGDLNPFADEEDQPKAVIFTQPAAPKPGNEDPEAGDKPKKLTLDDLRKARAKAFKND